MSVCVWIGRDEEVFKKPRGPSDVSMSMGIVEGEQVLSISRSEMGRVRDIRIGGGDVLTLLKAVARNPHYRELFHPDWLAEMPRRGNES